MYVYEVCIAKDYAVAPFARILEFYSRILQERYK